MTGAELRKRIKKIGISQSKIALEMGRSLDCISKWLSGARPIDKMVPGWLNDFERTFKKPKKSL